jgi:uncharacterized membrane protein
MPDETRMKKIYSAFFKNTYPTDLILIDLWLAVSIIVIYLPILNTTPLRIILALPIVLFIPGYCIIASLYPKKHDIGLIDRIALSFGLSMAVVPLIAYGLNFTQWGIRLDSVVISLTILIWALVLVAHYRRVLLSPEGRFRIPFSEIAGSLRHAIFSEKGEKIERLLTRVLYLAILVAVLTTVYVISVPKEGERFTEFFILGENKMAAEYPDMIITGQNYPIFIGVGNHEYRNVTYTIEAWGMIMDFNNVTNTSRIMAMDPLWQHSLTLGYNETPNIPYNLSINKTGYNRVEFLLFNESVPDLTVTGSDRINASYRNLYLRVDVKEAKY